MSVQPCIRHSPSPGFTLIEVIASMVIFAMGVLMVIQLNASLSERMIYAAKTSEIVVRAHERLDSIEALPSDSLAAGTEVDTMTVEGRAYERTATVAQVTTLLYSVTVTLSPVTAGEGPSYTAASYVSIPW